MLTTRKMAFKISESRLKDYCHFFGIIPGFNLIISSDLFLISLANLYNVPR